MVLKLMKKLLLLLLFIPLVSFSQKSNDADALKLCVALQSNNFTTDAEAEDAVNKILSVIGVSQKPILQACSNINNAVAAVYKGKRYVLYDREFMNSLTRGANKYWANMFILAHEIGHHVNGHSLDILLYANDIIDPKSLTVKREQELEADEFAGFVLTKLGANFSDISNVLLNLPKINNENRSTHPSKDKRIAAVKKGFGESNMYNIEERKLNYSITLNNDEYESLGWDNIITKPKEQKLKNISDPFDRLAIINDDDIPDERNTIWGFGQFIDNKINDQYKKPKLIFEINKITGEKIDNYNNLFLKLNDNFFVQNIVLSIQDSISNNKFDKAITNYLNLLLTRWSIKFKFTFEDGYSGDFITSKNSEDIWDLNLIYDSQSSYSERKVLINTFINKLKKNKSLYIRMSEIPDSKFFRLVPRFLSGDVKKDRLLYELEYFFENYTSSLSNESIKTMEFDLTGISKALNAIN